MSLRMIQGRFTNSFLPRWVFENHPIFNSPFLQGRQGVREPRRLDG